MDRIMMYAEASLDIDNDDITINNIKYADNNENKIDEEKCSIRFSIQKNDYEDEDSFLSRAKFKAISKVRCKWDNPIVACHIKDGKIQDAIVLCSIDDLPKEWGSDVSITNSHRKPGETLRQVINRVKQIVMNKYEKELDDINN